MSSYTLLRDAWRRLPKGLRASDLIRQLTQPFAGAIADRYGAGRVILAGVALITLGTFITPWMTSRAGSPTDVNGNGKRDLNGAVDGHICRA